MIRFHLVPIILMMFFGFICTAHGDVLSIFDHDFHSEKVYSPQNIKCSHCHNFSIDEKTDKATLTGDYKKSAFNREFKSICHECHQGAEAKNKNAPKDCFTCHRTLENMRAIKPRNHSNVAWPSMHSSDARTDGESCFKCHSTSQCVQCHQRRNDIELKNHSRNFRFMHSVAARAQPHKCDSCHSKTFCIDCHTGKR